MLLKRIIFTARVWCEHNELSVCISTYRATSLYRQIKLFELGSVITRQLDQRQKRGGSVKIVRTPEIIENVRQGVLRSPQRSTRRRAITVGISRTSLRRILHNDLRYYPYKIQIVQALHHGDNQQRIRFCDALLVRLTEDEDLVNNLWMSDRTFSHHNSPIFI